MTAASSIAVIAHRPSGLLDQAGDAIPLPIGQPRALATEQCGDGLFRIALEERVDEWRNAERRAAWRRTTGMYT